jgi:hypothetical protein
MPLYHWGGGALPFWRILRVMRPLPYASRSPTFPGFPSIFLLPVNNSTRNTRFLAMQFANRSSQMTFPAFRTQMVVMVLASRKTMLFPSRIRMVVVRVMRRFLRFPLFHRAMARHPLMVMLAFVCTVLVFHFSVLSKVD